MVRNASKTIFFFSGEATKHSTETRLNLSPSLGIFSSFLSGQLDCVVNLAPERFVHHRLRSFTGLRTQELGVCVPCLESRFSSVRMLHRHGFGGPTGPRSFMP